MYFTGKLLPLNKCTQDKTVASTRQQIYLNPFQDDGYLMRQFIALLRNSSTWAKAASLLRFPVHTQRQLMFPVHTQQETHASGKLVAEIVTYPTHNRHKRPTSTNSAGFELAILTTYGLQAYGFDPTATGIYFNKINEKCT